MQKVKSTRPPRIKAIIKDAYSGNTAKHPSLTALESSEKTSVINSAPSPPVQQAEPPANTPQDTPEDTEPAASAEPAPENMDIYAEIEQQVATALPDKPVMDVKEKCGLVFGSPFIITNFICDQVDKKSKYAPLAEIWHFDETEINEIVNYVYSIMEQYWPAALEKLSQIDVVFIIFNGIAIFMIFGKKIIQTMKFFKEQSEIKEKERLLNAAQPTPAKPAATAAV
jgi:hypothetical protein